MEEKLSETTNKSAETATEMRCDERRQIYEM